LLLGGQLKNCLLVWPDDGLRDNNVLAVKCCGGRTVKLEAQGKCLRNVVTERGIVFAGQEPIPWKTFWRGRQHSELQVEDYGRQFNSTNVAR